MIILVMTQPPSYADCINECVNIKVNDSSTLALPSPVKVEKTEAEKEADRQKEKERSEALFKKHFDVNVTNEFEGKFGFHEYTKLVFEIFPDGNETILLNVSDAHILRNDFNVCMTYMAHVLSTTYQYTFGDNRWAFQKRCDQIAIQKAYVDFIIKVVMCNNCYNFDTHLVKNNSDIWVACNMCQDFNRVDNISDSVRVKLLPLLDAYTHITETYEMLEREPPKSMTEEDEKLEKSIQDIINGVKPEPVSWGIGSNIVNYFNRSSNTKVYGPTVSYTEAPYYSHHSLNGYAGYTNYNRMHPLNNFNFKKNTQNKLFKYNNVLNERYRRFAQSITEILSSPNHNIHHLIGFAKENEMLDEAIVPILMKICDDKIFEDDQLQTNRRYITPFVTGNQTAQVHLILAIETFLDKYPEKLNEHYANLLDSLCKLKYVSEDAFKIVVDTPNPYIIENRRTLIRTKTDDFYRDLCNLMEYENISDSDIANSSDSSSIESDDYLDMDSKSHDVLPPHRPVVFTHLNTGTSILS